MAIDWTWKRNREMKTERAIARENKLPAHTWPKVNGKCGFMMTILPRKKLSQCDLFMWPGIVFHLEWSKIPERIEMYAKCSMIRHVGEWKKTVPIFRALSLDPLERVCVCTMEKLCYSPQNIWAEHVLRLLFHGYGFWSFSESVLYVAVNIYERNRHIRKDFH